MIFEKLEEIINTGKYSIKVITKEYLRGEKIFNELDICNCIAVIKRGSVKAIQSYTDGHDKIIRVLNQNEIIGLSLIFSSNPYYKASFYAETLTTIQIINKNDLLFLMKNEDEFNLSVLAGISDYSIRLNDHIKLLSYKTIRSKLCAYFYQEYQKRKASSFLIQYTKTELAAFLNIERPSLSFELSKLIKDNILANQNRLYTIIDINKLENEL